MPASFASHSDSVERDHPVSALGVRLRAVRRTIEAAAARGETTLLSREELERELTELRPNDPDVR